MKTIVFMLIALFGVSLLVLSQQGYFNVNPWLVFKQTGNILSKHEPVKISIPSLNTSTAVERVGIDELGKMDAPSNASIASWYQFSATPGDIGNVVISGHKDSTIGPGVFFTLRNIDDQASIILTRADGAEVTYQVRNVQKYERTLLPSEEIFGNQTTEKLLYLITCDGSYDILKKTYSQRIVVIAQSS